MSVDLGTGDGRLPWLWAREDPSRLFVGVDANAAGLRGFSGRAWHDGLRNALFVRAAVEGLPPELTGIADRVTIILPWGSLLAAVALPSLPELRAIRAICQPGARLTAVVGSDPARDRAELARLGMPSTPLVHAEDLGAGYAAAGIALAPIREIDAAALAQWPSSWARRLSHGRGRRFWLLEGAADGGDRGAASS